MERVKTVYYKYYSFTDLTVDTVREIVRKHTYDMDLPFSPMGPPEVEKENGRIVIIFGFREHRSKHTINAKMDFEKLEQALDRVIESIMKEVDRLSALNRDIQLLNQTKNDLTEYGIDIVG